MFFKRSQLSPPLHRALQGILLALFAPLGWLALQACTGASPAALLSEQPGLLAYMLVGSACAFGIFGWMLGKEQQRLAHLAMIDELTGLANPRLFRQRLDEYASMCGRRGSPMSLLLVDLDHFKLINDTFGHKAGDLALKTAAEVIRSAVRGSDVAARIGGEEFALLLPETGTKEAANAARRLLESLSGATVRLHDGRKVLLSASIGVAGGVPECSESVTDLFENADKALYRAKAEGRGRIILS